MPDGYSRSPRLVKGALVSFSEPFLVPVPSVIAFQYNPAALTRTLTPWSPPAVDGQGESEGNPTAQPFDPAESFTLTLELDATDALEEPDSHPTAVLAGVADRIAALEQLLYPTDDGGLLGQIASLLGASAVPRQSVPVLLFVWGPGRILPVRITSFKVEEQAFSPTLYPLRATVTIGLRVLTPTDFERPGHALTASEEIAVAAYKFTAAEKQVLMAAATVESVVGLLPI